MRRREVVKLRRPPRRALELPKLARVCASSREKERKTPAVERKRERSDSAHLFPGRFVHLSLHRAERHLPEAKREGKRTHTQLSLPNTTRLTSVCDDFELLRFAVLDLTARYAPISSLRKPLSVTKSPSLWRAPAPAGKTRKCQNAGRVTAFDSTAKLCFTSCACRAGVAPSQAQQKHDGRQG